MTDVRGFIAAESIVRKIWSTTDITLFIFAGASAEFALNRQVDWLFFTGKLPGDPIARLFSTVKYAQHIIFREEQGAVASIQKINAVHHNVESMRGRKISNEGYQDVLFMLIYYSISAFELLERKLDTDEKNEIVSVFARIGEQMHIHDLPSDYAGWVEMYDRNLQNNLVNSPLTEDLFSKYRKHLGFFRYFLLLDIQRMLVSAHVNSLLHLGKPIIVRWLMPLYRVIRKYPLHRYLIWVMVPRRFRNDLNIIGHTGNFKPES